MYVYAAVNEGDYNWIQNYDNCTLVFIIKSYRIRTLISTIHYTLIKTIHLHSPPDDQYSLRI